KQCEPRRSECIGCYGCIPRCQRNVGYRNELSALGWTELKRDQIPVTDDVASLIDPFRAERRAARRRERDRSTRYAWARIAYENCGVPEPPSESSDCDLRKVKRL